MNCAHDCHDDAGQGDMPTAGDQAAISAANRIGRAFIPAVMHAASQRASQRAGQSNNQSNNQPNNQYEHHICENSFQSVAAGPILKVPACRLWR